MRVVNPSTGETVRDYPEHGAEEIERRLAAAARAFAAWRDVPIAERAAPMRRLARLLRERASDLAELMAIEMGKPIAEGRAESDKCARTCEYYAERAADFLSPEHVETEAARSYVAHAPLGAVLAVMPWNFPLWQVIRFAAPALMAGNTALLKHAANVPGCALALEDAFAEAGFPEGAFAALLVDHARAEEIIADPRVAAVTLTGSTRAGRAVASAAGRALKKTVLELGGSDAYLILEDADLEAAAATCSYSRLINSGQSCIAAKRFIVVEPVRAEFERRLVERMAAAVVGDPLDERTEVGPLARADLRDELHQQVKASLERGAELRLGGQVPSRPGAWYPPTVLARVGPGMPAYEEELFGPVAAVIAADDAEDAIRIANDHRYGLGAAVLTGDAARGERIARDRLEAGACFVNTHVRSDPRLPFGGVKDSGYGRELGVFGIREFVNIKTVWVA